MTSRTGGILGSIETVADGEGVYPGDGRGECERSAGVNLSAGVLRRLGPVTVWILKEVIRAAGSLY